jgi:nicotinate phosphoribosyltransferase
MRGGRRLEDAVKLEDVRAYARKQMACLPPALREIAPAPAPYAVAIAPGLEALAERMDREQR